jgi:nucleotide-binding universal stress UspA family protein
MSRYGEPGVFIPDTETRAGGGQSLQRILVPVGSNGQADQALALAAQFSAGSGGQLRLIHVRIAEPPLPGSGTFYWETNRQATAVLERALTSVWAYGVPASGVVVDAFRRRAARAVAAEARAWRAEVMVVARRRRRARAISALLLGSLSDQLMREAGCPVLVVHQEAQNVSR